jgi:TonB family protein
MTEVGSRRPTVELALVARRQSLVSPGLIVSVVAHVALILAFVVEPADLKPRRSLSDQFVAFLLPPDRGPAEEASAPLPWSEVAAQRGTAGEGSTAADVALALAAAAVRGGGGGEAAAADTAGPVRAAHHALALDSVLTEFQVDSAVQRYPWTTAPTYPPSLLRRGIEGRVSVRFVVDTTGLADTTTFRVLEATHPAFGQAVREALPHMRFRPAIRAGVKVRQLVEQSFAFRITNRDTLPPARRSLPPQAAPVSPQCDRLI